MLKLDCNCSTGKLRQDVMVLRPRLEDFNHTNVL